MVLACLVCGRPIDALLTGGLHAGVAVMAVVTVAVVAAVARAVVRLLHEDRESLAPVAQDFSSAASLHRNAGQGFSPAVSLHRNVGQGFSPAVGDGRHRDG